MDNLPKLLKKSGVIRGAKKSSILKQDYNFENMIKDLLEDKDLDLNVRKSDINLSSFDSYFKKVLNPNRTEQSKDFKNDPSN